LIDLTGNWLIYMDTIDYSLRVGDAQTVICD